MLSDNYATNRRVISDLPVYFNIPVAQGGAILTAQSSDVIAEGGMRLLGGFKARCDDRPLVTVVTVVFNAVCFLEETILNVLGQSYDNVEYIIIDGGSSDGTLEIIKKYEEFIDYWVSAPDKGIYDAMNKAVDLAAGQWINFMNAGDSFFTAEVLEDVFGKKIDGYVVVYGDHEVKYPNKSRVVEAGNARDLWKGSQFSHQSAFVALDHHKKKKYNTARKIAADFEFFYSSQKNGIKMLHVPCVISRVDAGGVSDLKRVDSVLERWLALGERSLWVDFVYVFFVFREILKASVKRCIGALGFGRI